MAQALRAGLRNGGLRRGGFRPGLGNGSLFAIAPLDMFFARTRTLDSRVTFTRASSGTYVGSDRVLRTAATDVPRFDHNPTTGESLGLLVEEQRTNLIFNSEDTSTWLAPTGITLTQNSIAAPSSAITADLYTENTSTGLHVQDGPAFTFVTSTTYTYSVFVKAVGSRNFEIGFPATQFTARFARFTLSGSGAVQGVDAGVTASVQALGNGWYRCAATSTCAVGAGARVGNFIIDASHARNYTGNGSSGIYIWGAQLEAGSFPTSYIPTTTAAATRSADVASITGTNFSSWYSQSEGTVFASSSSYGASNTSRRIAFATDGTASNRFGLLYNSSNAPQVVVASAGTVVANPNAALTGANYAIAAAYKLDDYAISAAGSSPSTDTAGALPVGINQLSIGNQLNAECINGTIRRLTFWPARLPNSTLQAITQ